jgi:hypothetical protein
MFDSRGRMMTVSSDLASGCVNEHNVNTKGCLDARKIQ